MRERERESNKFFFFLYEKICIEWNRECHIYSNRMRIKRFKIKGRERDK